MRSSIETFYAAASSENAPPAVVTDCCSLPSNYLVYINRFRCAVSKAYSCDLTTKIGSTRPSARVSHFHLNLTEVFMHNIQSVPTLKWQYFLTAEGQQIEYPAHRFDQSPVPCADLADHRHRDVFGATVTPSGKHVVVVVDHGTLVNDVQLNIAKSAAKFLIRSLSSVDKLGVIGLSHAVRFFRNDECLSRQLVPATNEIKTSLSRFVDSLQKESGSTNHSLGFFHAFEMIANSLDEDSSVFQKNRPTIFYISRGLLASFAHAKDIFQMIYKQNEKLEFTGVIDTIAIMDEMKPVLYETGFLTDIAEQNYHNYDRTLRAPAKLKKGVMKVVNSTKELVIPLGELWKEFVAVTESVPVFFLPTVDLEGQELVLSIAVPCLSGGQLVGVAGVDVHLNDIMEDVLYAEDSTPLPTYLINSQGLIVWQPTSSRATDQQEEATMDVGIDVALFENAREFAPVREEVVREQFGQRTISFTPKEADRPVTWIYTWKRLARTDYIIVVRTIGDQELSALAGGTIGKMADVLYNRLDLLPPTSRCLHFDQLASLDAGSLFLSARTFESPFDHLMQPETRRAAQAYLTFLTDSTKLIANPGLRHHVRHEATIISSLGARWKETALNGPLREFVLRRFISTKSGVLFTYPAMAMEKTVDPTRRAWYLRALQHPDRVVITPPYLDAAGAGYIATISRAVLMGKESSSEDEVVAVIGMDVTLGFIYTMMSQAVEWCHQATVRCFLLDDRGYLVSHPSFFVPSPIRSPTDEEHHFFNRERLVANDIVNHAAFIKKTLCNRYSDATIQRFYQFNTSLVGILTNLVHGEHCARYQLAAVPGTNLFLGVINQTCADQTMPAFCACNVMDRLCLNCHRMEQNECECPCECPLEMDICAGRLMDEEDENPSCSFHPETISHVNREAAQWGKNLEQCFPQHCHMRGSKSECFGVMGCEWCEFSSDEQPLRHPFCGTMRQCYSGVLGSRTPYNNEMTAPVYSQAAEMQKNPVGPVAGGLMGCFFLLAVAVYCYRHRAHRQSQALLANTQAPNEFEEVHGEEDRLQTANGHTNIVLSTFENAPISPYRVNSDYQRPLRGADSDHGYSTMTAPDGDTNSEAVVPLILPKTRYRPRPRKQIVNYSGAIKPIPPPPPSVSSGISTSRASSPTAQESSALFSDDSFASAVGVGSGFAGATGMTVIPEANQIVINADVHYVDVK